MSSRTSLIGSAVIVAIVFIGVTGVVFLTAQYEPPRIAVYLLEPGFDDYGFRDQCRHGMDAVQGDISLSYAPFVFASAAEAETSMKASAASQYYDLIMGLGDNLGSAVQNAAQAYPNQKFAMIGAAVDLPNVASATFAVEEAAFLAGVLAAHLVSNDPYNGRIGVVASFETDPTVGAMVTAFKNGAILGNSSAGFGITLREDVYLGSDNNTELANNTVFDLFTEGGPGAGVSLIFAPVGMSIPGVRAGMLRANATFDTWGEDDRMPLVIAAGTNLDYLGLPDPDIPSGESWIPTSVVPRADTAIYRIINATLWNDFEAGVTPYRLANSGVNITDFQFSTQYIPIPLRQIIKQVQAEIIAGDIHPLSI